MKPHVVRRTAGLALAVILIAAVFGVRSGRLFRSTDKRRPSNLTVFAAASLSEAFTRLGEVFEEQNPGLHVSMNFAGSQQLAMQIEEGARADVFASADFRCMNDVQGHGLLASDPRVFAHNLLVVILPRSNPGRIEKLQDLERPGIKLVLAAEAVPVGDYSREVIENLSRSPGFGKNYQSGVLRNVVSHEEDVKAVLGKILLGEADAGIVYQSDAPPASAEGIRSLEIPEASNVAASYPIAVLRTSHQPWAARRFLELVMSSTGQNILRQFHFAPLTP